MSRTSLFISDDAIFPVAANIASPRTGPRRISSFRFLRTFITVPSSFGRPLARRSLGGGGRVGRGGLPLALELAHVGDDRPAVRGRDGPALAGDQPEPVRDHVEDLPVGVLQDLLLVK